MNRNHAVLSVNAQNQRLKIWNFMTKLINADPPYTINLVDNEVVECYGRIYFFCPFELKDTLYAMFSHPSYQPEFRLWSIKADERAKLDTWREEHKSTIAMCFEDWVKKSRLTQPELAKGWIKMNCTATGVRLLKEKFDDALLLPVIEGYSDSIFLKPDQVKEAVHYLAQYYSPENKKKRKQAMKKSDDYYRPDPIMSAFDLYEFSQQANNS